MFVCIQLLFIRNPQVIDMRNNQIYLNSSHLPTNASLALVMSAALALATSPAMAQAAEKEKCFGSGPQREKRLCSRPRHHMRWHIQSGLSRTRLDIGTQGQLHQDYITQVSYWVWSTRCLQRKGMTHRSLAKQQHKVGAR
jgi:hypothetical protein